MPPPPPAPEPSRDCPRCPRLVAVRTALRLAEPDWWNAPVPAWGDPGAAIAIVGLAPGRRGANRTGRPFTGDASGALLLQTLLDRGLATGRDDGEGAAELTLRGVTIVNAVRCLPPGNRPTPAEVRACGTYLAAPLGRARVVVALGRIAHDAAVRALGGRPAALPFAHGAEHPLNDGRVLLDSYHCSRLNQNTGRLTAPMLAAVVARAVTLAGGAARVGG